MNYQSCYPLKQKFYTTVFETYAAKKEFFKNPGKFYPSLIGLPNREQMEVAFKLLSCMGMKIPNIPGNQL